MKYFVLCGALALAACAHTPPPLPPEPVVRTVEVKVPTPMPCAALAKLGEVPEYADADAALRAAPDIFEQTKLLLIGRFQRMQRGAALEAARVACSF